MKWSRTLAMAGSLMACSHAEPFSPGGYAPRGPYSGAIPRRLTFNLESDRTPGWRPDGSAFFYSFGTLDEDQCLGEMPAGGAALTRTICDESLAGPDSIRVFEDPAVGPGGLLAYYRESSPGNQIFPSRRDLVTTSLSDPDAATPILSFPYTPPIGHAHEAASFIRWLGDGSLIYRADLVGYEMPCLGCVDTVVSGLEVARLDLAASPAVPTVIPGTGNASSVDAIPGGRAIYYTLGGDSRVYRRDLVTGAVGVVHNFGAAGIARDASLRAHTLVAVVGGKVSFGYDPALAADVQRDQGGGLTVVDLRTGQETTLNTAGFFVRRPAISPDGSQIVVEAYPVSIQVVRDPITDIIISADTTVGRIADLWLYQAP